MNRMYSIEFIVVEEDSMSLLRRETLEKTGLITVNYDLVSACAEATDSQGVYCMRKYPETFEGQLVTIQVLVHLNIHQTASNR